VTDSELHRRPLALDIQSPRAPNSLIARRGLRVAAMLVPESPKTYRQAVSGRGYDLGAVLGRSRANHGFTVVAAKKQGQRFAVKGTSEREFDGILTATLKGEYDILRDLSHPGIVQAEELIEGAGGCAMVMELCRGVCVEHLMPQGTALSGFGRHAVLWALLDAVAYLHGEFIAHRDLHPLNVMVDTQALDHCASEGLPVDGAVKLVDFGSALRSTAGGGFCSADELEDNASQDILPPEHETCGGGPLACDVFAVGLLAAGLAVGRPLTSADVVRGGALAVPECFLALSALGTEHLRSMLSLSAEARPPASACLDALPPAEVCPSPRSELKTYIEV
jgi:serine/threonine protein kinase